jgi:N6-L-threonylcarbamoyladenine synthase
MLFILGVEADELILGVFNLCAGFQMAVTCHLCQHLQHGMEFVAHQKLLPSYNKTLVCRQKIDQFSQNNA